MLPSRQLIPPFELRTSSGRVVQAWDYKQKKNLVLAFLHADCAPCQEFLGQLTALSVTWREQNTVVLVSLLNLPPGKIASDLPAEIVLGTDVSGSAAAEYLGADTAFSSASAPAGVFIADRYGELYAQWQVRIDHSFPSTTEIVSQLEHLEQVC